MAMSLPVEVGKHYSFQLRSMGVLPGVYTRVKLTSIVDGKTAASMGVDVVSLHKNIYPTLPGGTPNSPFQYYWLQFTHASGKTSVLGIPWIDETTLEEVAEVRTVQFTVENISPQEQDHIVAALAALGKTAVGMREI